MGTIVRIVGGGGGVPVPPTPRAGIVIDTPGSYSLTENMAFIDSGYAIKNTFNWGADDVIDFDLAGKTIWFGEGETLHTGVMTYNSLQDGNVGHGAFVCPSRPDRCKDFGVPGETFSSNPWLKTMPRLILRNGIIRSGSGAGLAYSNCVDLAGLRDVEIHDVEFYVTCDDGTCVFFWAGLLRDSTLSTDGVAVTNRHQGIGAVHLWDSPADGSERTTIRNCNISNNGGQTGIRAANVADMYENTILINTDVVNAYGIHAIRDDCLIRNNNITATDGRGIFINNPALCYENTVDVAISLNNISAHGIKLEDPTQRDIRCFRNYVKSTCTASGGRAAPLSPEWQPDQHSIVEWSVFIGEKGDGNVQRCWGCEMFVEGDITSVTRNSVIKSDGYLLWSNGWGGAEGRCEDYVFRNINFVKTGADVVEFGYIETLNYPTANAFELWDCTFTNCDERNVRRTVIAGQQFDNAYRVGYTASFAGGSYRLIKVADATGAVVNTIGSAKHRPSVDLEEFVSQFTGGTADITFVEKTPHWVVVDCQPMQVRATGHREMLGNRWLPILASAV